MPYSTAWTCQRVEKNFSGLLSETQLPPSVTITLAGLLSRLNIPTSDDLDLIGLGLEDNFFPFGEEKLIAP
jgi:hypothetical protein